ncbi:MAG: tetraacyldisaccharide 4'-kinase, partial [Pseudomonadota bacterium]
AGFFALLARSGICINKKVVFPDHHAYRADDYKRIQQVYEQSDFIITTEKDIAKIDVPMLQGDKLLVMEIDQAVESEEKFFKSICEIAGLPADNP